MGTRRTKKRDDARMGAVSRPRAEGGPGQAKTREQEENGPDRSENKPKKAATSSFVEYRASARAVAALLLLQKYSRCVLRPSFSTSKGEFMG